MRDALRIFRKDVRHLWPRILLVVAAEMAASWAGSAPAPARNWAVVSLFLRLVRWFVQWYVIIGVVHEESLVGDRQYWLTRPFSPKSLLLAKVLFCFAFINAPILFTDAATLAIRGLSPLAFLPALIAVQFFVLALVEVPALALASITTGVVRAVWVFLGSFIGFYLLVMVLTSSRPIDSNWGSLEWVHALAGSGIGIVAAAAVVVVQYARRDAALRGVLAVGLVALPLAFWTPGWPLASALQSRVSSETVPDSVAQISFDSLRDASTAAPVYAGSPGRVSLGQKLLVRITGIPEGMAVRSEKVEADCRRCKWRGVAIGVELARSPFSLNRHWDFLQRGKPITYRKRYELVGYLIWDRLFRSSRGLL